MRYPPAVPGATLKQTPRLHLDHELPERLRCEPHETGKISARDARVERDLAQHADLGDVRVEHGKLCVDSKAKLVLCPLEAEPDEIVVVNLGSGLAGDPGKPNLALPTLAHRSTG
jgi:hypothetical protein